MQNRNKHHAAGHGAQAPVFAALGDVTRLELVSQLCDGRSHSIAQLAHGRPLTRQAITKHLRVLENAGLVKSYREGRESRFEFVAEPLDELRAYMDRVSGQWDAALSRLQSFVED
ncbi:transcriptional regulator [Woeseia oceani]|uniref:Transcriptional regulator n=1 Tax=Woeseia oceani TaxID=1548547 RepID=A0A193LHQ8_9GAMM|nr:transcriptional regulator [Woeseia oceani]